MDEPYSRFSYYSHLKRIFWECFWNPRITIPEEISSIRPWLDDDAIPVLFAMFVCQNASLSFAGWPLSFYGHRTCCRRCFSSLFLCTPEYAKYRRSCIRQTSRRNGTVKSTLVPRKTKKPCIIELGLMVTLHPLSESSGNPSGVLLSWKKQHLGRVWGHYGP